MDLTRTDFTHGREHDALDRARLVHTTATTHAAELADYGLTPALLTTLDGHITAFADALSDPRHAIAERMVHTTAIEALIPEIDAILDGRLDRLVEQLKGTPFYTEYHPARTIVDD